jgi:hypothetical protein
MGFRRKSSLLQIITKTTVHGVAVHYLPFITLAITGTTKTNISYDFIELMPCRMQTCRRTRIKNEPESDHLKPAEAFKSYNLFLNRISANERARVGGYILQIAYYSSAPLRNGLPSV